MLQASLTVEMFHGILARRRNRLDKPASEDRWKERKLGTHRLCIRSFQSAHDKPLRCFERRTGLILRHIILIFYFFLQKLIILFHHRVHFAQLGSVGEERNVLRDISADGCLCRYAARGDVGGLTNAALRNGQVGIEG